jgi:hypothetical protein
MAIYTRGTLLENRRFLWTVSISFAVAAVALPLVILAAYGHFSSPPNQQTPKVRASLVRHTNDDMRQTGGLLGGMLILASHYTTLSFCVFNSGMSIPESMVACHSQRLFFQRKVLPRLLRDQL